jgi:hypothetical protein
MEAIRQIVKVHKDHEIRVKVPSYIPENKILEMILIIKERPEDFKQKIRELKGAIKDKHFINDLKEMSEDFKMVDLQRWE